MAIQDLEKDSRRKIFTTLKPIFKEKLGKYTHQRISDEWHFYGLGFVRDEMTYVFGYNIGFFKKDIIPNMEYSHLGMNVLVRTNGVNQDLRNKYKLFFESRLKNWISEEPTEYTSFRGGIGIELPRIKKFDTFTSYDEIFDFLNQGIEGLQNLFPEIYKNQEGIFSHVVRAAPPWHDTLLQMALENPVTQLKIKNS
jgi:hypothetical protein